LIIPANIFSDKLSFYGKMAFIPVKKAANCMDNLNTKNTILFVDDEKVILKVCTLLIEELGYKVLQAENSQKATQIFRDKKDVRSKRNRYLQKAKRN
jgi:hypothetical protein